MMAVASTYVNIVVHSFGLLRELWVGLCMLGLGTRVAAKVGLSVCRCRFTHCLDTRIQFVRSSHVLRWDPQVITGSHDSTIKLWDLRYGKAMATLTHHKKSVRALAPHPTEDCFVSASAENIKKFKLPKGEFMHNMLSQQKTIINRRSTKRVYLPQQVIMEVCGSGPGRVVTIFSKPKRLFSLSLDSEAGIYSITYDLTGSRLITCEAEKTIKMWKEDEMATPETHPLHFKPPKDMRRF
ncbi:hypothetical protein CASFOL_025512 [Castilleja foliolosa]|uniref:Uncharacterized protein n=1 Tax=Castilleja foliolosa TaxID=1961234 RepID=A0ABD3CRB5_9LAMI